MDFFWGAVGVLITVLIAVAGWQWRLATRLARVESISEVSHLAATAAKMRADMIEAQVSDFRVHVAQQYVNRDYLSQLETKLIDAINRLGDRLDKLFEGTKR